MKIIFFICVVLAIIGITDASYLTYEHYHNFLPPCQTGVLFADCGKVLNSTYATIFRIPLSVIGLGYYFLLLVSALVGMFTQIKKSRYALIILTTIGFICSLYFVYLQIGVIKAVCLYCLVSAIVSFTLFFVVQLTFGYERKLLFLRFVAYSYQYVLKKIFFCINPEYVHNHITLVGQQLGKYAVSRTITKMLFEIKDKRLEQMISGIQFENPIGLSAGFDYEGRLTQILPAIGFGFGTVGTITYNSYQGNPKPMLGRLPKSKSLMVNKGFKNLGAKKMVTSLSRLSFEMPVGISIGRTNTLNLKTQKESIEDIVLSFSAFEESKVKHSYYELNISCPNLMGDISFYPPQNLNDLLVEIDSLDLKKPVFIKMPIEKSNKETIKMLDIIAEHSPAGVIFGNLQKDRTNQAFNMTEIKKFSVGHFSGKPTFERSNELIRLAYKQYHERFTIIGCGGVFSGEDAYLKITSGASLVQLITGMIFQGPQLISQIHVDLVELLKRDGFTNISQAVGSSVR